MKKVCCFDKKYFFLRVKLFFKQKILMNWLFNLNLSFLITFIAYGIINVKTIFQHQTVCLLIFLKF